MSVLTDGIGNQIPLKIYKRIVSIVPSQTEFLSSLGLDQELIGITKFCIHPTHLQKNKTRVGGTKNLNIPKIKGLQPDLIIANKEENDAAQVLELAKHFPVYCSDISNLDQALQMMSDLGELCSKQTKADEIIKQIQADFHQLKAKNQGTCLYLIWKKPWMSVGKDTFISDMLHRIGYQNYLEDSTRYPEINLEDLVDHPPEHIFLSSEPYPFKENHLLELSQLFPSAKVRLVDGEYFSWYGSRLLGAKEYFNSLNHSS